MRRPNAWLMAVIGLALCAFAVRLVLIAHTGGGDDLRIYTYFSRLGLHGANPFAPPVGGPISPRFSNSPPLEVALFTAALWVHDSPTTLRVLFAIVDLGVLLLIGLGSPGPQSWRLAFVLFYGFNPLVLLGWTVYAEDKTILFAGIAVLILALERQRHWTAWLATTFLTAFKFLGAFVVPVLTLHAVRQRRAVILPLVVLVGVVAASAAFWFPDSLHAFSRRSVRLDLNPPINASPVLLLAKIGIYNTVEPRVLTVIGVLVVFGLFATRRIDICEAVVLSVLAGYVFLPDDAFDRLLLITLPFLLILRPKPWQWLLLWAVSSVAALGAVVATHGVPHFLSGVGDGLRSVFGGHEGTLRHVFWMSLPLAVVLVMFGLARRTRTPAAARRPAG